MMEDTKKFNAFLIPMEVGSRWEGNPDHTWNHER
jgi:hypothetical protein